MIRSFPGVIDVSNCQGICQENSDCGYFVYRAPYHKWEKPRCDLYRESAKNNRLCTLVHGTVQPDFRECVDKGNIPWEKKGRSKLLEENFLGLA